MLLRKVTNDATEAAGQKSSMNRSGKDDNLLDDLLTGSKIEEAKLVAADDFEAPVEVETVTLDDQDSALNVIRAKMHATEQLSRFGGSSDPQERTPEKVATSNNFTFRE
mmetsp:Transcript_489/g.639  ORF Transcript_489/g.639 Transcript_489/m.639 type:complete len:109 (+) Transcript_489:2181-2507(+)|eukprot:CAMPEP_0170462706 /NCGR_PEP_ID=MMETSP0123-20130129/8108_1 /TAXON_ID=182087 /ORGANISM="Favella ehrenbergii, Strain Fehren 1" /LENGTH=108 /DNA_ID=CAMNT_0010727987 /DNA_START=3177 /DNA_END=3503 /DNA_ORIENTATION=+